MDLDPVLIRPRLEAMTAAGFWRGRTINHFLGRAVEHHPETEAVVAWRHDHDRALRISYARLDVMADALARSLRDRGVGRHDVVAFQLPNWWQFVVLSLACARLGAVANPLMPILRRRELSFMLALSEAKVFVVPTEFRGFDHATMARDLATRLPHPLQVITVGGHGPDDLGHLIDEPGTDPLDPSPLDADDVMLLMYTSGTTGEPKGVMHTSNTLLSNVEAYVERVGLGSDTVILGASPLAHLTGYAYLTMLPIVLATTTVLQDEWNGRRALEIAAEEGVTFSMASSPFIADLCAAAEAGQAVPERFSTFVCAGAPIPPVLIERAREVLAVTVCSAWGMTENGAATVTEPDRAGEKSALSDGRAMPGMELRVVDDNGAALPVGHTGHLQVRGASQFAGYLKRPELNATDGDGWFRTGDLAFLDAEGYVRIDGRSKDLVIRGGENIPVVEVENLIHQLGPVADVAIVGYPDERLGERACAFVLLAANGTLTLDELCSFLRAEGIATQYLPERLELVDEMPRTPSGKIQKFRLRELAAARGTDAGSREPQQDR